MRDEGKMQFRELRMCQVASPLQANYFFHRQRLSLQLELKGTQQWFQTMCGTQHGIYGRLKKM